jgi:hypothetical protein
MMAERAPQTPASGPSTAVVYWKYVIFWLLLFGLLYFVSLYGIVAEA